MWLVETIRKIESATEIPAEYVLIIDVLSRVTIPAWTIKSYKSAVSWNYIGHGLTVSMPLNVGTVDNGSQTPSNHILSSIDRSLSFVISALLSVEPCPMDLGASSAIWEIFQWMLSLQLAPLSIRPPRE